MHIDTFANFIFSRFYVKKYSTYIILLLVITLYLILNDIKNRKREVNKRNKLMAISSIITIASCIEEIKEKTKPYLGEMLLPINMKYVLESEHKIFAAFLFQKSQKSLEKNVELEPAIIYEEENFILKDHEILELIGNFIDNAIEASICNTKCYIRIHVTKQTVYLSVKNCHDKLTDQQIGKMFKRGYSTKVENPNKKRGYGLSNAKEMIEKNNGIIYVQNENIDGMNYVVVEIII